MNKIITNRDKINSLSNNELKNFIFHGGLNRFRSDISSENAFKIWLNEPYDEKEFNYPYQPVFN